MDTIHPTLYIGIGSTGAQILGSLQKHLFEEYQVEDLPIFHLVGLVSDDSDHSKANDIYNIEWYHMRVPNTSVVKEQIKNPIQDWEYYLKKWLPPILLDIPSFTDGAGGKRVAGRLLLWENYERISTIISQAKAKILNSQDKTLEILKSKNIQNVNVANDRVKVFIFGSLCGGTCSGMCVDMAYLVRNIMEQQNLSLTGIFTIPNFEQSIDPDLQNNTININSYCAVTELAYFFYYGKKLRPIKHYLFDKEIEDCPPYDDVYLESSTNEKNKDLITRESENGSNLDSSSLNEMIGMNLFLETFSGFSIIKNVLNNYLRMGMYSYNDTRYLMPDPIIGEPRAFCSFGLTNIYYPQYSIARAAACDLLKDYFSINTCNENNSLSKFEINEIRSKFELLSNNIENKLFDDLEKEINTKLDSITEIINSTPDSDLEKILRFYPEKEPFSKCFSSNGCYTQDIQSRIGNIRQDFISEARKIIDSFIETGDSTKHYLMIMKIFKEYVSNACNKTIKEVEIDFNQLTPYINKIEEIKKDWFLLLSFSKDKSIKKQKEQLGNTYKEIIRNAFNQLRINLCKELYKEIDNHLRDENIFGERLDYILKILEKEKRNVLKHLLENKTSMFCSETKLYGNGVEDNQLTNWAESEVSKIVSKQKDTINETRIYTAFIGRAGLTEPTIRDFENELLSMRTKEVVDGCSRMIDELTKTIIKRNEVKISFTELFKKSSKEILRQPIEDLITRSFYYIQLDDAYYKGGCRLRTIDFEGLRLRLLPLQSNFDKSSLNEIYDFNNNKEIWRSNQLSTNNSLWFYTEEPGFAPSHMKAYKEWAKSYEKLRDKEEYTSDLDWTEEEWRRTKIEFKIDTK